MLRGKDNDLEDRIVELVAQNKSTAKSIHRKVNEKSAMSLRAIYKAIHRLIGAGVLLKTGRYLIIDQEWARRVTDMLEGLSAPTLSEGERVAYTFLSMEHLDAFWKTTVLPLEESSREIFFYNPHNFWIHLPDRKESEEAYYRHFQETKRYGFFTIGGSFPADMEFKKKYQNNYLQIDLRNIALLRKTDHLTIIDSWIITVRLAKDVSEGLEKLYASGENIRHILPEIIEICSNPTKIRFVLENNKTKAKKLKKIFKQNFYIV